MLEYNQDLMDQAKQMISGGKYKKKVVHPAPKGKNSIKIQIEEKSKLPKKADFVLTLSILITIAHVFLCCLTYETFKTPSANGHGGFVEFLAFIIIPILLLAWVIDSVAFSNFLSLCNKQSKSPQPTLRAEAKNERKAVDIAVIISFISMVAFWAIFFLVNLLFS